MNQRELAKALAKDLEISVQAASVIVQAMVKVVGRTLAQRESVCLSNFGTLRPVHRKPRSFGPGEGERPSKPDIVQVQFRAADKLVEAVKRGDHQVNFQKRSNELPRAS